MNRTYTNLIIAVASLLGAYLIYDYVVNKPLRDKEARSFEVVRP